jgi:EAL domain-containing protein (putative c-di-GMP-specific phosphodiesterase class I)
LKIDRSFVSDLCARPQDRAVVKAVVFLAENFGLDVIAEGVETEDQASVLAGLGCRLAQGFLYSPAIGAARLLEMMAGRPAKAAAA